MAVIQVDVLQDGTPIATSTTTKVVELEVQNIATSSTVNNVSLPAVEVVSPTYIANVVVSPTAPAIPYEGQIWIDIS